jgi:Protein of unknown function (DUF3638)
LATGEIYITRKPNTWNINPKKNWIVNIEKRCCTTQRPGHIEYIVDPSCRLVRQIYSIMNGLEEGRFLQVSQPSGKTLKVQIPRKQLTFVVNRKRLLFSPQLRAEIDTNQDIGTFYGLKSMLVCRNPDNPAQRTVLVPLGPISTERFECHVAVTVKHTESYLKYTTNTTIGRIDCAAEPVLIYTKALLHAYTSFCLPDPLTGRTGTEESLHWLDSGMCQPWMPFRPGAKEIIDAIANLSPIREYYPAGLKAMKTDHWRDSSPSSNQHPSFRLSIEQIMAASERLRIFTPQAQDADIHPMELPPAGDIHLNERALVRRQLYERQPESSNSSTQSVDLIYRPRDRATSSNRLYFNVLETVHLLSTWPAYFKTPKNLAMTLSRHGETIGGYGNPYDKVALSDRLHTDLRAHWGSLVRHVRQQQSRYSLMFLFAPLAFRPNLETDILCALAAFSIFGDLRKLPLPAGDEYVKFRSDRIPQPEDIEKLIQPFKLPPPDDDRDELGAFISAKQLRQLQDERAVWNLRAERDVSFFAKYLLKQWPCIAPDVSSLSTGILINVESAMDVIRPEWRRLCLNKQLSDHLNQVQRILDHRRSDVHFKPVEFVMSGEVFPSRIRGQEVPLLSVDLIAKTLVESPVGDTEESTCNRFYGGPFAFQFPLHSPGLPSRGVQNATNSWPSATTSWRPPSSNFGSAAVRHKTIHRSPPIGPQPTSVAQFKAAERQLALNGLRMIVDEISGTPSLVRQRYAEDLKQSLQVFEGRKTPAQLGEPFLQERDLSKSEAEVSRLFSSLHHCLERERPGCGSSPQRIRWLQHGRLWPAITTVTLLEQLRSTTAPKKFGKGMRQALLKFGIAITKLQREMRLNDYARQQESGRYYDEEINFGHENWRPEDRPDWLLLEIESNLLIRPDQVEVALATIAPASGTNSVLQMNMGQGTSFLIETTHPVQC